MNIDLLTVIHSSNTQLNRQVKLQKILALTEPRTFRQHLITGFPLNGQMLLSQDSRGDEYDIAVHDADRKC